MSSSAPLEVTRSGGFAGLTTTAVLDLDSDDPRAVEARSLVERIDFAQPGLAATSHPDGYVYEFRIGDVEVSLPDQQLTEDQRALARLVLG